MTGTTVAFTSFIGDAYEKDGNRLAASAIARLWVNG
jgi:hypothetical protein